MPRFNSLSQPKQEAISALVADFLRTAHRDLFLTAFTAHELRAVFRKFDIKIHVDGRPASGGMWRAIDHLTEHLAGPSSGPCECCGDEF